MLRAVNTGIEEGDDVGVWKAGVNGFCNANGTGVVGLKHAFRGSIEFKGASGEQEGIAMLEVVECGPRVVGR